MQNYALSSYLLYTANYPLKIDQMNFAEFACFSHILLRNKIPYSYTAVLREPIVFLLHIWYDIWFVLGSKQTTSTKYIRKMGNTDMNGIVNENKPSPGGVCRLVIMEKGMVG